MSTKQKTMLENYIKDFDVHHFEKITNQIEGYDELTDTKKLRLLKQKMSEIYGNTGSGKHTLKYWLIRGWKEEVARLNRNKNKKTRHGKSLFGREYWLSKGFSEEEADFKRNSIRPIRKEYWLSRGFSEEEAEIKAKTVKQENNTKGANKNTKCYNGTSIEYWLLKGFSEEESKQKLSERQTTFTLEKCIEKHGEEKGRRIWQKRQDKWQKTMNGKSDEEKSLINFKKNPLIKKKDETLEKYKTRMNNRKTKFVIITNKDELYSFLKIKYESSIFNSYMTPDIFSKKYVPKRCYNFLTNQDIKEVLSRFDFKSNVLEWHTNGGFKFYNKFDHITGKLLRSMREIVFCDILQELNIDYEIETGYNNSNMRCDFYLPMYEIYIEIAGNMDDEDYKNKMYYKQETFGSVILVKENEYRCVCESILNGSFDENQYKINL